jgi:transposase-like protein
MSEDGKAQRQEQAATAATAWTVVSREALIAGHKEDGRTVYRCEAKQRLVAAASEPGASVAKLAREHGLNANQLHSWIRMAAKRATQTSSHARFSVKVGAGLERAAKVRVAARVAAPVAQLLPVAITPSASVGERPLEATQSSLCIEIGGARIVVNGAAIDRATLTAVIDCLRDSAAK